jgi:diketogulonate reductase-like aldo/keto reductase
VEYSSPQLLLALRVSLPRLQASVQGPINGCVKHLEPEPVEGARDQVKITVKLMLLDGKEESVAEALAAVTQALQIDAVDLFILSMDQMSSDSLAPSFLTAWRVLEEEYVAGRVLRLGVSDLSSLQLTVLLDKAVVKPTVNQVMFNKPCDCNDKALLILAVENGVELMTYSDRKVLVPVKEFRAICREQTGEALMPRWVARYNIMQQDRSVIMDMGFLYGVSSQATIISI